MRFFPPHVFPVMELYLKFLTKFELRARIFINFFVISHPVKSLHALGHGIVSHHVTVFYLRNAIECRSRALTRSLTQLVVVVFIALKAQLTTVANGGRFIAVPLPVHKSINNREWQNWQKNRNENYIQKPFGEERTKHHINSDRY